MSEKNAVTQEVQQTEDDKKNLQGVVDYLQAPRKKRKNFVVVATKNVTDQETTDAIVRFVKANYPKYAVATPQNMDEFLRQFSRNIILTVIDDEFVEREQTLNLIKTMKERKSESPIPTLFLTRDPEALIDAYTKTLYMWHEIDEYAVPALIPRHYLFAKIKNGIDERYRRRGRRFKVNFPAVFTVLDSGGTRFEGRIVDMSVHGGLIEGPKGHVFNPKDQITVHLPLGRFVKDLGADVLRVSARVRRIFISGNTAGLSWEYLTDAKTEALTKMLASIIDATLYKQASQTRARIAKANAELEATSNRPVARKASAEIKPKPT
jgi:hypothetical protein